MKDLSLMYLLNLAWRRIIVLAVAFVVFAAVAFGYCEFVATPSYSAKSSILLTNGGSLINTDIEDTEAIVNNDIVASINMMDTYIDFLKEPKIYQQLEAVIRSEQPDSPYTWMALRNMATIAMRSDRSLFIDITFSASDPNVAVMLTNYFADLTPAYFSDTFSFTTVDVTSKAEKANQTYPVTTTLTALAGILGVVIAFGVVFLIDSMDQAIAGEEGYTSRFDVPLLGSVPYFESSASASNYGDYYKEGY